MSFPLQHHLPRFGQTLRTRAESISTLSFRRARTLIWAFISSSLFKALALIGLAVCVGNQAREWTGEAAISAWHHQHPPGSGLVSRVLGALELVPITDPTEVTRRIRWMPTQLDTQAEFWVSRDLSLVVYFAPTSDGLLEPLVLRSKSLKSPTSPKDWERLGQGWSALEALLERLKNRPLAPAAVRRPSPSLDDPREFKY